eukprot:gene2404-2868_t
MKRKNQQESEIPQKLQKISFKELKFVEDFSTLSLKANSEKRPLIVCPNNLILVETFSPYYEEALDFITAIAEPLSRPNYIHEYKLTDYSLMAAASIGLKTEQIINILEKLNKYELSEKVKKFIIQWTKCYGKIKLVLQNNNFYIESQQRDILEELTTDEIMLSFSEKYQIKEQLEIFDLNNNSSKNLLNSMTKIVQTITEEDGEENILEEIETNSSSTFSFEIETKYVENVKKRCNELKYPLLEEYHFRKDEKNENLNIDLKPETKIRDYQEKSLSKVFGNGRARSGLIVLPCGAGKTLVGITTTCTIKKKTLVLCNSNVSVEQWYDQFLQWSTIPKNKMVKFTADFKDIIPDDACILFTTYNMLTFNGTRSEKSQKIIQQLEKIEWGLMVLDEVHIVPADIFRKVISIAKAHCKLGLTATLLREDDKIQDLYFLIGPKLYETNWMNLQERGYLAKVECIEVWCPMTAEYMKEYLISTSIKQNLLSIMNPNKFKMTEFLIKFHEEKRNKIIVFSDDIFALKEYSKKLQYPSILGETSQKERLSILNRFQQSSMLNCVFISKVGDTSIDLPEASVIIQISSHYGSRRQETQRLGRILRPKMNKSNDFNAFFYTLVSQDTSEMYHNTKRQQFLLNQGYIYRVLNTVPQLLEKHQDMISCFKSKSEEKNLLARIKVLKDSSILEADEKENQTWFNGFDLQSSVD